MKGRNGSTSFLPSKGKGGFPRKNSSEQCLTKKQMNQIYDNVESGEEVRIRKLIWQNISHSPKPDTAVSSVNQYEKALLSERNMRRNDS